MKINHFVQAKGSTIHLTSHSIVQSNQGTLNSPSTNPGVVMMNQGMELHHQLCALKMNILTTVIS